MSLGKRSSPSSGLTDSTLGSRNRGEASGQRAWPRDQEAVGEFEKGEPLWALLPCVKAGAYS